MRHDLCALHDLSPDGLHEFEAGGIKVLLARDGDRVLATGATCTHKGAPLKNGQRVGTSVVCPWHHAIFDLESGAHREPPGKGCLARFEAGVDADGRVHVEVPEGAGPHRPDVRPEDRGTGDERVFAIVGGGAAGLACAEELVRRGFGGRIRLFVPENEPPYDRTDLTKTYLQGKKNDGDLALLPAGRLRDLGIELVEREVRRIDAEAGEIEFTDGARERFSRCFAAPGSAAASLDMPGAQAAGVFRLRSHEDARRLREAAGEAKRIVMIGSGFIGMEAAASLQASGKSVTVLSRSELPFARPWGEAVARRILQVHRDKGVEVRTGVAAERIETEGGRAVAVVLEGGERIEADLVLAATGAAPRSDILSGVRREGPGVAVDARLHAGGDVFAGGDIAQFPLAAGGTARIEHWRVAEQHGRHAAGAMLGDEAPFRGVPFFWTAQFSPLRYVGHAEGFDEVHVEGALDEGSFTAFYVSGGRVLAALGQGKGDRTAALHALMLADPAPARERLAGADWDPARLL